MDSQTFFHLLNALLMIGMPVALSLYLIRRFQATTPISLARRILFIGAATFLLSQVLHIPFNQYVLSPVLKAMGIATWQQSPRLVVNAVAAGLSAGLFESLARYLTYRYWAKDARSWGRGLILGAGHGGIEALLLGFAALWGFLQMSAMRNADLSQFFSGEQLITAQQQVSGYWSMAWHMSVMGAFERAFAILMHLAASLLVLQVFRRKQLYWLGLAIGWHALLDAGSVYLMMTRGVYWAEGWVALIGMLSLAIIYFLRRPEEVPTPSASSKPVVQPVILTALPKVVETPEELDQTRFRK